MQLMASFETYQGLVREEKNKKKVDKFEDTEEFRKGIGAVLRVAGCDFDPVEWYTGKLWNVKQGAKTTVSGGHAAAAVARATPGPAAKKQRTSSNKVKP